MSGQLSAGDEEHPVVLIKLILKLRPQ